MENSKKIVVALGLALAIVGIVASHNALAMEQRCNISPEIKEMHQLISDILRGVPEKKSYRSSLIMILHDHYALIDQVNQTGHMWTLMVNVAKKDFLQNPRPDDLKQLIKFFNNFLNAVRNFSAVPGVINPVYEEAYSGVVQFLPKLQKFYDLIEDACGTSDEAISDEAINERKQAKKKA